MSVKPLWKRKWLAVLGLVVPLIATVYIFWIELFGGIAAITGLWRYPSVVRAIHRENTGRFHDADVLKYIPKVIPAAASNCQLFYWTPPGDTEFNLRCTLPAGDVKALVNRLTPEAILITPHIEDLPNGPAFFVGEVVGRNWTVPNSYTFFLMQNGAKQDRFTTGVAIDSTNNNVIYWFESQ